MSTIDGAITVEGGGGTRWRFEDHVWATRGSSELSDHALMSFLGKMPALAQAGESRVKPVPIRTTPITKPQRALHTAYWSKACTLEMQRRLADEVQRAEMCGQCGQSAVHRLVGALRGAADEANKEVKEAQAKRKMASVGCGRSARTIHNMWKARLRLALQHRRSGTDLRTLEVST